MSCSEVEARKTCGGGGEVYWGSRELWLRGWVGVAEGEVGDRRGQGHQAEWVRWEMVLLRQTWGRLAQTQTGTQTNPWGVAVAALQISFPFPSHLRLLSYCVSPPGGTKRL